MLSRKLDKTLCSSRNISSSYQVKIDELNIAAMQRLKEINAAAEREAKRMKRITAIQNSVLRLSKDWEKKNEEGKLRRLNSKIKHFDKIKP